jgi:signal peptidase I
MSDVKKRSALLAGLFNLLCPGLGFLYLGRVRWAIGMFAILPAALVTGAWSKLILLPLGYLAILLSLIGIALGSMVAAALAARRQAPAPLGKIQRWYIYIAYFLISGIPLNALFENRANVLGYETFRIPNKSMRETLLPGDFIMSNTWKFRDTKPVRGEIVIFRYPPDPTIKYIKRVVGLPGETIQIGNGEVRVNGKLLVEPYVTPENNLGFLPGDGEYQVPPDSYFTLGDNRDYSHDSRAWGSVPSQNLHGSAEYIWFSYDKDAGLRTERLGQRIK